MRDRHAIDRAKPRVVSSAVEKKTVLPDKNDKRSVDDNAAPTAVTPLPAATHNAGADYAALAADVRAYQAAHNSGHVPVMLDEVLQYLNPRDGGVYVDGTFGAGGYTRAILQAANCTVYGIDRDPAAITRAQKLHSEFGARLVMLQGCFGDVRALLAARGVSHVDGFVLDLGVSSPQLDEAARGFSFREDGPLDMRMGADGQSAADLVNQASEEELANIIFEYGEERASRRIARRIIAEREIAPITTTRQLAKVVHDVLPMHGGMKTDTATRTFQALRIAVNDELGELDRALDSALEILAPHGRMVVVSFHSLEDGRVKKFFKQYSGDIAAPSRHLPQAAPQRNAPTPPLALPVGKPVSASARETAENPRARSARLRVAERTSAPFVTGGSHA